MAGARRLYYLYIYSLLNASTIADSNLGPLITTFTPPSTCFSTTAFPATFGIEDVTGAGLAFAETYLTLVSNQATSCYPSNFGYFGDYKNYFSPGIVGPSGWSTGGVLTTSNGEASGVCCPSGFRNLGFSSYHSCSKTVGGALTASAVLTRTGTGLEFYLGSMSTQFSSTDHTLLASAIPLRWRDGDVASSSATVTSNPTSVPSRGATVSSDRPYSTGSIQSTSTSSSTTSTSTGGALSTGDRIALGVGIPAAAVGVPGAIIASMKIWRRWFPPRRRP